MMHKRGEGKEILNKRVEVEVERRERMSCMLRECMEMRDRMKDRSKS